MKRLFKVSVEHEFYGFAENERMARRLWDRARHEEDPAWVEADEVHPDDTRLEDYEDDSIVYQDGSKDEVSLVEAWPKHDPATLPEQVRLL